MHTFKRFLRGFCSLAFKLAIVLVAVSASVITVFGSSQNLKATLKTSGVYTSVVDSVIDQAKNIGQQSGDEGGVPISDPAVQAAIAQALPADFLEKTSAQAIDGVFGWLDGTTKTPQFNIDLKEAKLRLANGVADAALARAQSLKICTVQELQTINSNADFFSLTCLPPNINLQAERDKLYNQIANGEDFFKDTTVTSDDLPKEDGKTVFDKAAEVPTAYQWLVRLPWLFGGVALLSLAGLIFLHDKRRRGLQVAGRSLVIAGVTIASTALLTNFLVGQVKLPPGEALQATAVVLGQSVVHQLNAVLIKFSIGYLIVGIAIFIGLYATRPKELEQTPTEESPKPEILQEAEQPLAEKNQNNN